MATFKDYIEKFNANDEEFLINLIDNAHAYAGTKAEFIGDIDNGNKSWIPTKEQVDTAKSFLTKNGIKVL